MSRINCLACGECSKISAGSSCKVEFDCGTLDVILHTMSLAEYSRSADTLEIKPHPNCPLLKDLETQEKEAAALQDSMSDLQEAEWLVKELVQLQRDEYYGDVTVELKKGKIKKLTLTQTLVPPKKEPSAK